MKRRRFLGTAAKATAALSAAGLATRASASNGILGANDRVTVGWVGCGGRGRFVAGHLLDLPSVEITVVCDVYERNVERAKRFVGPRCIADKDFRRVLDREDIDAVLVATPDHWHAIPTVMACQAGKDVYVEKPVGHNVAEGQAMLGAARRFDRVVQTGTQQRSAEHFEQVRQIIQNGDLGELHYVRIWNYRNMYPDGIGHEPDSAAPDGLDWDFFLGPAPTVPYNRNRHRRFRYFWDYAGGVPTDWGTHRFDMLHFIMNVDAPVTVSATGGRSALNDDGEVPEILQATYQYPGFVLSYEACMLNAFGCGTRTPGMRYYHANGPDDRPNGMAFYGTNGTLFADRLGFEIYPELRPGRKATEKDRGSLAHFRIKPAQGSTPDSTRLHVRDFIDCVRSRQRPRADVEYGHRASTVAHLANIAYKTGRRLQWDPDKQTIVDDPEATKLLSRDARDLWDLI
jgi:predicted dehydrogenase